MSHCSRRAEMPIHYWNQENFRGLLRLAQGFAEDPLTADLARYCELREQGVRREAFTALERFVTGAKAQDTETQRRLALRVFDAHCVTPEAHQFLSDPLRAGFVEPVLEAWIAERPNDPTPNATLALLRGDRPLLEGALALDPNDDRVRARLISALLWQVDFATHHLSESRLIGSLQDVEEWLTEATGHLDAAPRPNALAPLAEELAEYRRLVSDFVEYQSHPEGSFPEWCRARGHGHRFGRAIYYRR